MDSVGAAWFGTVALFGLVIGSFLNVCVHRLPRGISVVTPPSACPRCKKRISWYDNVPVLSWLFLRGKCRNCGKKISARYPLVEMATAGIFLWVAAIVDPSWDLLFLFYYAAVMLVITLTDFDLQLIPDSLTLPGIVVGLAYHGWWQGEWTDSLLGILAGGGSLFLIAEVYLRLRRREGMGGGDVKLAAMMGAFLGWQGVFLVLFASSLAGGVFGAALILFRGKGGTFAIPFGVFLAPIGFLAILYGDVAITWYLDTMILGR